MMRYNREKINRPGPENISCSYSLASHNSDQDNYLDIDLASFFEQTAHYLLAPQNKFDMNNSVKLVAG